MSRVHGATATARLIGRRELLLLQVPHEQGQRPLEDLGDVAGRDLVSEQVLRAAQTVMALLAHRELDGKALGRQRLHRGTLARQPRSDQPWGWRTGGAWPGELLAAATHRTKSEIEQLLAERFPQPDMLAWVAALPGPSETTSAIQQAPGPVENRPVPGRYVTGQLSPGIVAAGPVCDRSSLKPLAPQRFAVQFTMSQQGHDSLRRAQELLGHQVANGDIAQIFEKALTLLVGHMEQQKFAATDQPRRGRIRGSANPRHIPADVKRAVWERDGSQCTFESETGRRCEARSRLEFDHVLEVARGGEATVDGVRLRCRAHNQYAAECTFGSEFMRHKRIAAAEARTDAKSRVSCGEAPLTGPGRERTGP